jgi:heterogeneous nuclear ribonucleoprotein F/H
VATPAPVPRAFAPPPPHGRPAPQSAAAVAAAASAAASKLPLAAAISTVHQAVGSGAKREAAHTCVLKMRGLPFSARKADVIAFFGPAHAAGAWTGAALSEDSIHIVQEASGRPAGIAFAEFASADEARAACAARNRKSMGARYVELFPSSRDEATRVATGGGKW